MFIKDGKRLPIDTPFVHDEVQYPANWLRLASPEEREAIGITEVADPARPDVRFYFVTDNPDGSFTATPRDLATVKRDMVAQVKIRANAMLAPTDWRVVRAAEGVRPLDPTVATQRALIRATSDAAEAAISAAADLDALASLQIVWPAP